MIRFCWTVCGIVITGIIVTGAVLTVRSYTDPDSAARIAFTSLAIIGEMLIIVSMKTMTVNLAKDRVFAAIVAASVWVPLSAASCYACSQWFKETLSREDVKQIGAQTRLKAIDDKLAAERHHLESAEQVVLSGRTSLLRDNAKSEAELTRKRIIDLEAQRQWPAEVITAGSVNNIIHGYEIEAAILLFGLSQVCWFFGLSVSADVMTDPVARSKSQVARSDPGGPARSDPDGPPLKTKAIAPETPAIVDRGPNVVDLVQNDRSKVSELLDHGLSQRAIAIQLGISRSKVQRIISECNHKVTAS